MYLAHFVAQLVFMRNVLAYSQGEIAEHFANITPISAAKSLLLNNDKVSASATRWRFGIFELADYCICLII